jgi:hypothetical protein
MFPGECEGQLLPKAGKYHAHGGAIFFGTDQNDVFKQVLVKIAFTSPYFLLYPLFRL